MYQPIKHFRAVGGFEKMLRWHSGLWIVIVNLRAAKAAGVTVSSLALADEVVE
jgi:hypothetical protein